MFNLQPNAELNELFATRPYQGAHPADASFLFVGLDANYDAQLDRSPAFQSVLEYHHDGVAFWRCHGVHHPFLLPSYRGDGRRYHQNFAKIGAEPRHAHLISFVELLHVPTVGRNMLTPADLDRGHLGWLDTTIREGKARYIFVSDGVARLMHKTGAFAWLRTRPASPATLPSLYEAPGKNVYKHLHFSNYGKFQQQLERERGAIASLLPSNLGQAPAAAPGDPLVPRSTG